MPALSIFMAVTFYLAFTVLVVGVGRKVWIYYRTPAPLKIPTTPAPVTSSGVVLRIFREVVFFESLFKANKWIWLFGWMFHFALVLVLLRHFRYFQEPMWFWVGWVQPFGKYAAWVMLIGLLGLFVRRIFVARIKYISAPSDYLMLLLLLAIGGTGALMRFVSHTDIIGVKAFFIGLMRFDWQTLPDDALLIVHLSLVATLMLIFPISKLLHAPGVFFSPSRNQVDNPREKRHLSGWAAELSGEPTKSTSGGKS